LINVAALFLACLFGAYLDWRLQPEPRAYSRWYVASYSIVGWGIAAALFFSARI